MVGWIGACRGHALSSDTRYMGPRATRSKPVADKRSVSRRG